MRFWRKNWAQKSLFFCAAQDFFSLSLCWGPTNPEGKRDKPFLTQDLYRSWFGLDLWGKELSIFTFFNQQCSFEHNLIWVI